MDFMVVWQDIASLIGWGVAGLVILFIARMVYDRITPFDLKKELVGDKNAAVGVSQGMFMLASSIIVHGMISADHVLIEKSTMFEVDMDLWLQEFGVTLVILVLSFSLLGLGRLFLSKTLPFDFDHEIHENDNLAVGLVEGFFYVAFSIIVHAAL
jgi:uncharacterized membrane protein YjfL (UPF0719 family)